MVQGSKKFERQVVGMPIMEVMGRRNRQCSYGVNGLEAERVSWMKWRRDVEHLMDNLLVQFVFVV